MPLDILIAAYPPNEIINPIIQKTSTPRILSPKEAGDLKRIKKPINIDNNPMIITKSPIIQLVFLAFSPIFLP